MCGFVSFSDPGTAAKTKEKMNGASLFEKLITVKFANRPQSQQPSVNPTPAIPQAFMAQIPQDLRTLRGFVTDQIVDRAPCTEREPRISTSKLHAQILAQVKVMFPSQEPERWNQIVTIVTTPRSSDVLMNGLKNGMIRRWINEAHQFITNSSSK